MRYLLFSLFIGINTLSFAQNTNPVDLIPTTIDSIQFRVENIRTKEMLLIGQEEVYELMGSFTLLAKERQKLAKKLRKPNAYSHGRALLDHHNLVFSFFNAEKLTLTAHISTLTRNIDLYAEGKPEFYGKISKKFGKFLIKLLVRVGLYDAVYKSGDLEGIVKYK